LLKEEKMDVQLKELIDKIKTEGVGEADAKAKQIIDDAEHQSAEIIQRAKKEAEDIVSKAKTEAAQFENASKEAVRQAGRDLILNIKRTLTKLFDSIIKNETSIAMSEEVLKDVIPKILSSWEPGSDKGIDLLLSSDDAKNLEKALLGKLSSELKGGVEIKPHAGIKAGFRISVKDGDSYYDFTDEGISENLIQHLNPVLSKIISESKGE
jgi:V/A-type H+/Na+-transporting ATPase subunit E